MLEEYLTSGRSSLLPRFPAGKCTPTVALNSIQPSHLHPLIATENLTRGLPLPYMDLSHFQLRRSG
jgi:hypothetical protein